MHLVTVMKQCPSASLQCNPHRGPGRDSAGTFYGEIRASMEDRQLRSVPLPLNVMPPEPTIHCTLPCSQRGQRGCLQSSGRSFSGPAYGVHAPLGSLSPQTSAGRPSGVGGGGHWPFPYMLWPLGARGARVCVHGAASHPERSMCSESNSPKLRCGDWGLDQTWAAIWGCHPGPAPHPRATCVCTAGVNPVPQGWGSPPGENTRGLHSDRFLTSLHS